MSLPNAAACLTLFIAMEIVTQNQNVAVDREANASDCGTDSNLPAAIARRTFLTMLSCAGASVATAKTIVAAPKRNTTDRSSADRTLKLLAALELRDEVLVNAGDYEGPIDITASNKRLIMERGVRFIMPNGTVAAADTTGPAVLQISGDNVIIEGEFTVDGNRANNDSSGFPTSEIGGSLNITGNNCSINGTVTIENAYYVGFTVGNSQTAGGEVQEFSANRIVVRNANYYSVNLWSVVDWNIGQIFAYSDTLGVTRDQRIRTGSQSSATSVCARGHIGFAFADQNCSFVGESNTVDVSIDTILTGDGGKLEDCSNVRIGHWNAYNCSNLKARTGFFLNGCVNCDVGSVSVRNFDDDGSGQPALSFSKVRNCTVRTIVSEGNRSGASSQELRIRSAKGLYLGTVVLRDPVGDCDGFLYDHGYPPQEDITVGQLVSRGHATWDVTAEDSEAIKILSINADASNQYPANTSIY